MNKGFTLVELLISVGIFVVMTVLLIVKYGNFNQSVLLTNLAYDVALVMRTAQTYGLSVVNSSGQTAASPEFQSAYGVDFSVSPTPPGSGNEVPGKTRVILFADSGSTAGVYDPGSLGTSGADILKNTYNITRGAVVSGLCVGNDSSSCVAIPPTSRLDITFKRPDPTAIICADSSCTTQYRYARITITGTDGSTRALEAYRNGQISIIQ